MYYIVIVQTQSVKTEVSSDNENDIFCSVIVHDNATVGHKSEKKRTKHLHESSQMEITPGDESRTIRILMVCILLCVVS
jgi:hypothetical protein